MPHPSSSASCGRCYTVVKLFVLGMFSPLMSRKGFTRRIGILQIDRLEIDHLQIDHLQTNGSSTDRSSADRSYTDISSADR